MHTRIYYKVHIGTYTYTIGAVNIYVYTYAYVMHVSEGICINQYDKHEDFLSLMNHEIQNISKYWSQRWLPASEMSSFLGPCLVAQQNQSCW